MGLFTEPPARNTPRRKALFSPSFFSRALPASSRGERRWSRLRAVLASSEGITWTWYRLFFFRRRLRVTMTSVCTGKLFFSSRSTRLARAAFSVVKWIPTFRPLRETAPLIRSSPNSSAFSQSWFSPSDRAISFFTSWEKDMVSAPSWHASAVPAWSAGRRNSRRTGCPCRTASAGKSGQ